MALEHDFVRFPELTNNQMNVFYFDSPHKQITDDFFCKCIKVTDGDSIKVTWEERDFNFPIRLADIDAPERRDDNWKVSKEFLEDLILDKVIMVEINKANRVSKWGQILGRILQNGVDINDHMVFTGHAVPFRDAQNLFPSFEDQLKDAIT